MGLEDPDRSTFEIGGRALTTEELVQVVYGDLRRLADRIFRREAPHRTLQPTALVNEAYMRLADQDQDTWKNRAQFLAVAARCMRRVLVDAARARHRDRRADSRHRITLNDQSPSSTGIEVDMLDLEAALERLGRIKERYVELIELRYFGGLELQEVAEVLGVSRQMVVRDFAKARVWLTTYLSGYEPPE